MRNIFVQYCDVSTPDIILNGEEALGLVVPYIIYCDLYVGLFPKKLAPSAIQHKIRTRSPLPGPKAYHLFFRQTGSSVYTSPRVHWMQMMIGIPNKRNPCIATISLVSCCSLSSSCSSSPSHQQYPR